MRMRMRLELDWSMCERVQRGDRRYNIQTRRSYTDYQLLLALLCACAVWRTITHLVHQANGRIR